MPEVKSKALRNGIVVLALTFPLAYCVFARSPVLLKGTQSTYEIPAAYVKSAPQHYGDPSKYDTALVLSLAVPLSETTLRVEQPNNQLTALFYADKPYELNVFLRVLKRAVEDGSRPAERPPFFVYRRSVKGYTRSHYATFDPEAPAPVLTPSDYYVTVTQDPPFTIAGHTTTPLEGCKLTVIRDGVLIDVNGFAALCSPDAFPQWVLALDTLLDRWRQK